MSTLDLYTECTAGRKYSQSVPEVLYIGDIFRASTWCVLRLKKNYCLTTLIIKFQLTENGVCTTARSNIHIRRHLTYLQEVYHVFHRCACWSVRYIHWKSRLSRKWNSHLPLACLLLIIFSILFSIHFYKLLTRRICLTIKSLFSWWSFPLFSWP